MRTDVEASGVLQNPIMGHPYVMIDRETGRIAGHYRNARSADAARSNTDRFYITPSSVWFADYKGG